MQFSKNAGHLSHFTGRGTSDENAGLSLQMRDGWHLWSSQEFSTSRPSNEGYGRDSDWASVSGFQFGREFYKTELINYKVDCHYLVRAHYFVLISFTNYKWNSVIPRHFTDSVSSRQFREFCDFSTIAENHRPYLWYELDPWPTFACCSCRGSRTSTARSSMSMPSATSSTVRWQSSMNRRSRSQSYRSARGRRRTRRMCSNQCCRARIRFRLQSRK